MRFILAASFVAVFIATTVKVETTDTNTSCTTPFNKIMLCNLMCNLLQDSQTNAAMKTIQTKLENLITVVNKPPPPGKWLTYLLIFKSNRLSGKKMRDHWLVRSSCPSQGKKWLHWLNKGSSLSWRNILHCFDIFCSCSCFFMQGAIWKILVS